MIYFITIVTLLILISIYDFNKIVKGMNLYYYIVLVVFILTAGLRYRIGLDTIRYMNHFQDMPTLFNVSFDDYNETKFSAIYYSLALISKTIHPSFVFFQILHAIILNSVVFYFIKKNTRYIFSGALLYYLFCFTNFNFEVLRESIAIVFFLLSVKSLLRRNWIKYYLFVLLAFLSHPSAILLFFIPFFIHLRMTKLVYIYMGGVFLFSLMISDYVTPIFELISITDSLSEKADRYLDSELMGQVFNINGLIKNFIIFIFFPLISMSFLKRKFSFESKYEFLIIFNFFVSIMAIKFGLFYRYFNYFIIFDVILFAEFGGKLYVYLSSKLNVYSSSKFSLFFVAIIFSSIIFLQVYSYFTPIGKYERIKVYSRYYPYSSIIGSSKDNSRERLFRYHGAY